MTPPTPTERDVELANLLSEFLQRDGYPQLTDRMMRDLRRSLAIARKEGHDEGRDEIRKQVREIIQPLLLATARWKAWLA